MIYAEIVPEIEWGKQSKLRQEKLKASGGTKSLPLGYLQTDYF